MKQFNIKIYFILLLFVLGFIFCLTNRKEELIENFDTAQCQDILLQKGNKFHLLNTKKARVPGVNPVVFNNLEEYAEYVKWQDSMGIKCPVLYFQEKYDAQNNRGFQMEPDPLLPNAGTQKITISDIVDKKKLRNSHSDNPPYNQNQYSGFDYLNQDIGTYTSLDAKFHAKEEKSWNPRDSNWGGQQMTNEFAKQEAPSRSRKLDDKNDPHSKINETDRISEADFMKKIQMPRGYNPGIQGDAVERLSEHEFYETIRKPQQHTEGFYTTI